MTDRLADLSLRAFADDLASERPVPGGGSAAAYAGALGAALGAMVGRIAAKKASGHAEAILAFDALRADLLRLVDEDSAAFARVMQAMRLPKATDEEKRVRTERVQAALLEAARVPLEAARTSRRLLDACERAVETAPAAAVSDIGVGALMAEAALRGAALNVMSNLASLKDADRVKALSEELDRSLDGAEAVRARVLQFVESRIAR